MFIGFWIVANGLLRLIKRSADLHVDFKRDVEMY